MGPNKSKTIVRRHGSRQVLRLKSPEEENWPAKQLLTDLSRENAGPRRELMTLARQKLRQRYRQPSSMLERCGPQTNPRHMP